MTMPDEEVIFNESRRIDDPAARAAYLERTCGSDTNLRARIESLLDMHDQQPSFLVSPAVDRDAPTSPYPPTVLTPPGTVIGRYKILQSIGEGGYGTVFMAEQTTPVHRKVALKIVKAGMDTRQVIARFEAERQALALMDHPNIAKVFDAGMTETGRPYFVMELVKGMPITKYCDEHRLAPRDRLELFVQVCRAVQHAHQKGIIHRDIKPSNVIVAQYDTKPVPKVIDFGVAKATGQQLTERTMFTGFGDVIGTPEYMSPEQAELNQLDIDTRSDIYSLGVLLYELLTGTTPIEHKRVRKAALLEVLRVIREEEPPKPSTRLSTVAELPSIAAQRGLEPKKLSGCVRGELDWIVMKALEKDRNRRYESANGLAMDIQRHLSDESVMARPASSAYRFRKLVRRNRLAFAMTSAVAAAILLGGIITTWQAIRATRSEHEQIRLREEAENQRTLAMAAAAREREAAEQERQAKLQATLRLADNYTSRGLEDGTPLNARAALWFANAAVTSHDDPDRVEANLIRVNNWLRDQWTPVAAVEQADNTSDHLTFDPENSRYLMTVKRFGTDDGPPQIFDLATEQPLSRLAGFGPLGDAAWAPDGKVLLGTQAGQVVLASMPELKILKRWDAGSAVRRVAASPDGQVVAAAAGKKLLLWKVSGPTEPAIVGHAETIVYIAFSPSGQQLVTATDDDAKAHLFAFESDGADPPQLRQVLGPVPHFYRGPRGAATSWFTRPPIFVDGGRQLVTIHDLGASAQLGEIKWYDTQSGAELAATKVALDHLHDVAVSPDGSLLSLATGNSVNFDTRTRAPSRITGSVLGLAFSPNGKLFAFGNTDLEVRNVGQSKIGSRVFPMVCQGGRPAFSSDGKYMAVLRNGLTQVLRLPGDSLNSLARKTPFDGQSSWAGFSPNGKYVAPIGKTAGSSSVRTIQVRLAATGTPVGAALELNADLVAAGFSPDSTLMAVVTGIHGDPGQLRIWNWLTGTLVCDPAHFDSEPVWTCFAPDGKAVAVHCMNGEAFLIDPAGGDQLLHLMSQPRHSQGTYPWASGRGTIRFSHDGRTLFTWGSEVVQAWDRASGNQRWKARHQEDCWSLAESPDGRIIATGSYDRYLRFWDAATGNEFRPPIEHPSQVLTVAFSPDGRVVGTSCLDWQIRLWEVSTGKLVCAMSSNDYLTDVRFTPDSRFAVVANAAGLQVWDARAGYRVSQVCRTYTHAIPSLDIASDGHWAVVAGQEPHYTVVNLEKLIAPAKVAPEEVLIWTELLSNSRVSGSTIANLTPTEWLERWQHYRRQHPEFRSLDESTNTDDAQPATKAESK
jgi:serine/threonine protein kinase/WD40 repeat protein